LFREPDDEGGNKNKKAPPGKHSTGGAKHDEQKMKNRRNQPAWLTIFDSLDILRAAVFL